MLAEPIQPIQLSAIVGTLLAAYYLVPYLLDPHDYRRRFSGPWLASFTNWWISNTVNGDEHCETIRKLHQKHAKRKRIANIFSQRNVLAFEPRVKALIQQAVAQLDMRCRASEKVESGSNWTAKDGRAVIDCCPQLSFLAFDIIGDLALGSPFGLIEAQKDIPTIQSVDTFDNRVTKVFNLSVIHKIARGGRAIMSLGFYPQWTHHIRRLLPWNIPDLLEHIRFVRLTADAVEARIKRGPKEMEDGKKGIDLIDRLLDVRNADGTPLSKWEIYVEAILLLIAGSDTTSNSLSALCYYLAAHPQAQRRLQAELDSHTTLPCAGDHDGETDFMLPSADVVVEYEQIKNLPYLNACLKEALRLFSTVGTGFPRVVPPGKSFTFGGETFNAGSIISVPSFTTNRSSVWGTDAEDFRPERWLEDGSSSFNNYYVPFSTGPRGCAGKNLANMDMLPVAATIFRRYEFEALPTSQACPWKYESFWRY